MSDILCLLLEQWNTAMSSLVLLFAAAVMTSVSPVALQQVTLKEDCIAYIIRYLSCILLREHYVNVLWWIMLDSKYFLADSTRCTKHYGGISSGVSWCYLQQRHSSLSSYPHHGTFQQCSDCDGTSSRCWVILPIFSHLFQQYSWLLHWCHKWRCEQQPVFLDFIHPRAKWIPNAIKSWCIQLLHFKQWVHCHMALWEHINVSYTKFSIETQGHYSW